MAEGRWEGGREGRGREEICRGRWLVGREVALEGNGDLKEAYRRAIPVVPVCAAALKAST